MKKDELLHLLELSSLSATEDEITMLSLHMQEIIGIMDTIAKLPKENNEDSRSYKTLSCLRDDTQCNPPCPQSGREFSVPLIIKEDAL